MARLTKADSVYRMSLHKNGGYMYATTHPYTVSVHFSALPFEK